MKCLRLPSLFIFVVVTSATAQFDIFESIANFFNPSSNNINSDSPRGGGRGCAAGGNPTNYKFGGKNYLVSWRIGCSQFTQAGAEHFCKLNGMRPISIDSASKQRNFLTLIQRENQRFFWTGGKVRGGNISWPSGRRFNDVDWSNTGGSGRAQPDNREGNEVCLAVLNNFYRDGVKFHDVSCHHRKPVICE